VSTANSAILNSASSVYSSTELKIDTLGYDQRGRPTGYTYVMPSITGFSAPNGLAAGCPGWCHGNIGDVGGGTTFTNEGRVALRTFGPF
jgi:hypothetical protein